MFISQRRCAIHTFVPWRYCRETEVPQWCLSAFILTDPLNTPRLWRRIKERRERNIIVRLLKTEAVHRDECVLTGGNKHSSTQLYTMTPCLFAYRWRAGWRRCSCHSTAPPPAPWPLSEPAGWVWPWAGSRSSPWQRTWCYVTFHCPVFLWCLYYTQNDKDKHSIKVKTFKSF